MSESETVKLLHQQIIALQQDVANLREEVRVMKQEVCHNQKLQDDKISARLGAMMSKVKDINQIYEDLVELNNDVHNLMGLHGRTPQTRFKRRGL